MRQRESKQMSPFIAKRRLSEARLAVRLPAAHPPRGTLVDKRHRYPFAFSLFFLAKVLLLMSAQPEPNSLAFHFHSSGNISQFAVLLYNFAPKKLTESRQ